MKIAVYTIAKNEEQFLSRWHKSAKDADYLLIADTGSTDKTVDNAIFLGINVFKININPWRFEDARNVSLALLPSDVDVAICLDMDEVLVEGWREKVEKAFKENPEATRLRYSYIWNWIDGKPGVTYHADKIHIRNGCRWKNPVHEVLHFNRPEVQVFIPDTLIEHHADDSKPRSQYLPLLKMAVEESPNDDRMMHYYGRELLVYGHHQEAINILLRHLEMPEAKWNAEKAASARYIGDCYWELKDFPQAFLYFTKATELAPECREPWVAIAQAFRAFKSWKHCKEACEKALAIKDRPSSYINSPVAWSNWPQQMLDEANSNLT